MTLPSSHAGNSTAQYYSSAPLPSPTSTAPQHFFFPPSSSQWQSQPNTISQQQSTNQHLHPQSQQQETQSQGLQHSTGSSQMQGSIPPSQDPSSPLRRDFGLLAEAAKRAQIAVITRDMGDVGL